MAKKYSKKTKQKNKQNTRMGKSIIKKRKQSNKKKNNKKFMKGGTNVEFENSLALKTALELDADRLELYKIYNYSKTSIKEKSILEKKINIVLGYMFHRVLQHFLEYLLNPKNINNRRFKEYYLELAGDKAKIKEFTDTFDHLSTEKLSSIETTTNEIETKTNEIENNTNKTDIQSRLRVMIDLIKNKITSVNETRRKFDV